MCTLATTFAVGHARACVTRPWWECPPHAGTDGVFERSGGSVRKGAMWRAAPTVRSREGWGSRLSRWRVRRSGSGGRRGQQEGRAADEGNLGREMGGHRTDDEERQVHAHGDRVGQPWVAVIVGIVRDSELQVDPWAQCRRCAVGLITMMFVLVRSRLVQSVVRIPVCDCQAGGVEARNDGNQ